MNGEVIVIQSRACKRESRDYNIVSWASQAKDKTKTVNKKEKYLRNKLSSN